MYFLKIQEFYNWKLPKFVIAYISPVLHVVRKIVGRKTEKDIPGAPTRQNSPPEFNSKVDGRNFVRRRKKKNKKKKFTS